MFQKPRDLGIDIPLTQRDACHPRMPSYMKQDTLSSLQSSRSSLSENSHGSSKSSNDNQSHATDDDDAIADHINESLELSLVDKSIDIQSSRQNFYRSNSKPRRSVPQHDYPEMTEETPLIGQVHVTEAYNYKRLWEVNPEPEEAIVDLKEVVVESKTKIIANRIKIGILFVLVIVFSFFYAFTPDLEFIWQQASISKYQDRDFVMANEDNHPILKLNVRGYFLSKLPTPRTNNVNILITNPATNSTQRWQLVVPPKEELPQVAETVIEEYFTFRDEVIGDYFDVRVTANAIYSVPIAIGGVTLPIRVEQSVVYAALILAIVYVLIIFELTDRTVAAMIGSLLAISTMALMNEKPNLESIMEWLDYDTLALLFGMMVLVAVLSETGFFDWVALFAYKVAKGKTWPLITILCVFAAVISAFLDNVTTILLLSPVTIRLCEVLDLDPKHVLIAEVMFSNIGGTATAIGDPPNVIILSNRDIMDAGIDFGLFTLHMAFGSILAGFAAYGVMRFMYRRRELLQSPDPPGVKELKHEIEIWKKTCSGIDIVTREQNTVRALLMQKIVTLENKMNRRMYEHRVSTEANFETQVKELERTYYIRDKRLLIKCMVVLVTVILGFFSSSFIPQMHITVGWIPLIGSIWLLVLADRHEIEGILHRVEWGTLIFFAALFVLMDALTALGLIDFITAEVTALVKSIDEESRLAVAIIVILWISALSSSFIDNIPYTTAMLPVIVQMSGDESVNLPLEPLVWALAFGACLGGNGTLIGASANVVCAGIAESHGYGFTFKDFFRVGFPMMIITTIIAMCYLLICHVAFEWH